MAASKETVVRSRTVSLRDIYIAKVTSNTESDYTTETPIKLARAITAKITDEREAEKIYSDDAVEDVNISYKGTIQRWSTVGRGALAAGQHLLSRSNIPLLCRSRLAAII